MTDALPTSRARTRAVVPPVAIGGRRGRRDLSGRWRYILDPCASGLSSPSYRRDVTLDVVNRPANRLFEYDFDASPEIDVPGDWNTQRPELLWYEGLVWYRTRFDAAAPVGGRKALLYFESANFRARVFLNGTAVGLHEGGFTPFAFDVSDLLADGSNSLVVGVDGERSRKTLPGTEYDWMNYAGLTGPVHLLELPATYIEDARLWLDGTGRARARVVAGGHVGAGVPVTVRIPGLDIEAIGATGEDGTWEASLGDVAPSHRWSPRSPRLHEAEVVLGEDRLVDLVGFRHVAVRGSEILLNGRPIRFRGVNLHDDRFGVDGGRCRGEADCEALLHAAKDLGCNFVRLAHYPHNERMTQAADRLGLMVWSEIPVYWRIVAYDDPDVLALARRMQREHITRDFNRASIVFWSVGNETPLTDDRLRFLRTLVADARAQDATRLVSTAMQWLTAEGETVTIDDPIGEDVDVLAVNRYEAWYTDRPVDRIRQLRWESRWAKPMIMSEFGCESVAGRHGPASELWTEEFQVRFYEETLAMMEGIPFLRGMSAWCLKDYRSPLRYHGALQQYWLRMGLLGPTGEPRKAHATLAAAYARLASQEKDLG